MMRVAIVGANPDQLEGYPVLKSIQRVFKNLSTALESEFEVIKIWKGEHNISQIDVIIGTYEALKIRRKFRLDIPALIFPLGDMPNGGLMLFAYHGLFKPYDCIAFSCSSDLVIFDRLVERCCLLTEVIPLPIDCELFYRRSVKQELLRKKYGIPEYDRLIFYAGRISLQKNLHILIRMFEDIIKEKEATLCIAGVSDQTPLKEFGICGDDYADKLEKMISNKGLTDKVRFIGYLDDNALAEMYSISDLFVNPTLHYDENFGFSQVEAQSCGLPVVASKWGGIKDTVIHGETGFLMETVLTDNGPRVEWHSGVRYILNLLSDDLLWRGISDKCKVHVLSNFSIGAVGRKIKEVLKNMVSIKMKTESTTSPVIKIKDEVKNYIIDAIKPNKNGMLRYHILSIIDSERAKWFYKTRMEPYSSMELSKASDIIETAIPYRAIDLKIVTEKGNTKILDLVWQKEIQIDPKSLSLLLLADGKKRVDEICSEVGIPKGEGIKTFGKLIRKGLILCRKEL